MDPGEYTEMDSLPIEKENAAGNVAKPLTSKSTFKAPSQDGPSTRVPLRTIAAKPQEHIAVRAVSAANKRLLERQPTASFAPSAQQGESLLPHKRMSYVGDEFAGVMLLLSLVCRTAAAHWRGGIFRRLLESGRSLRFLRSSQFHRFSYSAQRIADSRHLF
jgi:hypothetical protein